MLENRAIFQKKEGCVVHGFKGGISIQKVNNAKNLSMEAAWEMPIIS